MKWEKKLDSFSFLSLSQENRDSYILNVLKRYTWLRPKSYSFRVIQISHDLCYQLCLYYTYYDRQLFITFNHMANFLCSTWFSFSINMYMLFLVCLPSFIFAKKIYICEICCDNFKEISGELLHVVYFTAPVFILKSVALCCSSLVWSKVRV